MKITIDLELTVDEIMTVCQNFTEKEKVTEEVKSQKDTFDITGLEEINEVLKDFENDKEYLEKLTWEQKCFHAYMLRELLSNEIISQDEWRERLTIIANAWRTKGLKEWTANNKLQVSLNDLL